LEFGRNREFGRTTYNIMTPQDEKELHRLTDMLRDIDAKLQRESPLREGLKKAGLALCASFIHNLRPEIEQDYVALNSKQPTP
jgi:hypothetical protein